MGVTTISHQIRITAGKDPHRISVTIRCKLGRYICVLFCVTKPHASISPRPGKGGEAKGQTDRETDGQRDRQRDRQRERRTDRQTDRQRGRQPNVSSTSPVPPALFSFFFLLFFSFFFLFFLCAKGDSSVVVARDVVPDNLVRDGESSELVRLCPFLPLSGVMTCVFLQKSGCDAVDNNGVCLLCDVFGDRYRHTKGREGGKGGLTVACCVLT